ISQLSPAGWRNNWFSTLTRKASRIAAIVTWDRVMTIGSKTHEVTFGGRAASRSVSGTVSDTPIIVEDTLGRTVRSVTFGSPTDFEVRDYPMALLARDVWQASERIQIDMGVRLDHRGRHK